MPKRKSTGTRLRFTVFQRDGFTCQYCGRTPPEVILHADHIVSVNKGGLTELDNLVTSCQKCNLGKHTSDLKQMIPKMSKNADELAERYEQLLEFYNYQKKSQVLNTEILDDLCNFWIEEMWNGWAEIDRTGRATLMVFMKTFSTDEIREAMAISASRMKDSAPGFKYFCGIMHNKRKEKEEIIDIDRWRKEHENDE